MGEADICQYADDTTINDCDTTIDLINDKLEKIALRSGAQLRQIVERMATPICLHIRLPSSQMCSQKRTSRRFISNTTLISTIDVLQIHR